MLKSALMIATSLAVGAGAVQLLHAAGGPPVYFVAMVNVKDMDGYTKDFLPKVQASMKGFSSEYIAGGMNKTTRVSGEEPPNRVVIIKRPNIEAYQKWRDSGGLKIREDVGEKYGQWKAEWLVEGIEPK